MPDSNSDLIPQSRLGLVEPHTLRRWCGHTELVMLSPPWEYVDAIASALVCNACRRLGKRGPLDGDQGGGGIPPS